MVVGEEGVERIENNQSDLPCWMQTLPMHRSVPIFEPFGDGEYIFLNVSLR